MLQRGAASDGRDHLDSPVSVTARRLGEDRLRNMRPSRSRSESEPNLGKRCQEASCVSPAPSSSSSTRLSSPSDTHRSEIPLIYGKKLYPGEGRYEGFLSFDGVRMGRGRLFSFDDSIPSSSRSRSKASLRAGIKKNMQYEYDGEWKDDKPHGTGTYRNHVTSDRYSGGYADGKRHGPGVFLWGNGDKYTGNFDNGVMNGLGRLDWANGDSYHGTWTNGSLTGSGSMIRSDGTHCEGSFRNGLANGYAVKSWSYGDRYAGELRDDDIEGYGTYLWREGHSYEGQWLRNQFHGIGKHVSVTKTANGTPEYTTFFGEYQNGVQHGVGIVTVLGSGATYCGEVVEQLQTDSLSAVVSLESLNSLGSRCSASNERDTARQNELASSIERRTVYGSIEYESGLVYCGDCLDAVRHGTGLLRYTPPELSQLMDPAACDGSSGEEDPISLEVLQAVMQWFCAEWVSPASLRRDHSVESLLLAHGGEFIGTFAEDVPHGPGSFTFSNGQELSVEYLDGHFVRVIDAETNVAVS